jgi:Fe-S-cluster containining protein
MLGKHEEILRTIAQEELVRAALESKDSKYLLEFTECNTQGTVTFQLQLILNSLKDGCHGCSICCQTCDVDLNFYDIERLAENLKISQDMFVSKYCTEAPLDSLCFVRLKNKPCVFLKDNKCIIYQQRPTKCVLYPFISDFQGENIHKYGEGRTVITVPTWCNAGDKAVEMLQN